MLKVQNSLLLDLCACTITTPSNMANDTFSDEAVKRVEVNQETYQGFQFIYTSRLLWL